MGFLSFFKNRQTARNAPAKTPVLKVPEANANTAQLVAALLQVHAGQRDNLWSEAFYQHIQTASFECGEPAIITGPGGHSFFVLKTPAAGQPFEPICIRDSKDFLLDKGFGVAINPTDTNAEWLFSHGDIVNLHVNGRFVTELNNADIRHIEMTKRVQVVKKGEEIMLAQPSDKFLPLQTRKAIKKLLEQNGIRNPMTLLMCRKKSGHMIEELAFNTYPGVFSNVKQRDDLMQAISWFLPRHYTIVSFREDNWMAKYFEPL